MQTGPLRFFPHNKQHLQDCALPRPRMSPGSIRLRLEDDTKDFTACDILPVAIFLQLQAP